MLSEQQSRWVFADVFGEYMIKFDTQLPMHPHLRYGQLDNGLTYYVLSNHRPENRAELRLVVRAGSVLEDDDQQGLA